MLQLTSNEVASLPSDTKVYEGVGKMQVSLCPRKRLPLSAILFHSSSCEMGSHINSVDRFVFSPIAEVDQRLTKETSALKSDVENLGKKLQYLETTHKNSREHIDQIFKSGGRA